MKVSSQVKSLSFEENSELLKNTLKELPIGLHNIQVAMGAGKTTAVKQLMEEDTDYSYCLISPYEVQKNDFMKEGVSYSVKILHKGNFFIYVNTLLKSILDSSMSISEYVKSLYTHNPLRKIILDEYDVLSIQVAKHTTTQYSDGRKLTTTGYSDLFESLLKELSNYFTVIKLSATKEPDEPSCSVVKLGTSVRMPSILNYVLSNQNNTVATETLFKIIDKATLDSDPIIVYKSHYEVEYYGVMAKLAAMGISTLLLTRNQRLEKVQEPYSKVITYAHELYNFYKVGSKAPYSSGFLKPKLLVVENTEDKEELSELFNQYQVVFINMGYSRVVSVFKEDLVSNDEIDSATVITIGKQINAASIQTAGRFRDIPVKVHNILTGAIDSNSKKNYEGDTGFSYLCRVSPCSSEYGIEEISLALWKPRVTGGYKKGDRVGKAKGSAKGKAVGKAKGKAVGKAKGKAIGKAKGKAIGEAVGKAVSQKTKDKRELLKNFLENTKSSPTYRNYLSYCVELNADKSIVYSNKGFYLAKHPQTP